MSKHLLPFIAKSVAGLGRRTALLLALAGLVPAAMGQTFGPKTDYPTGSSPSDVALGDVNGDGRLDFVTANSSNNTVSVLLGTGTGSFGPKTDYPTGTSPQGVALGDVNGDGRLDVVTVNYGSTASVLLGTGAGAFSINTDYATGFRPDNVALGDVNGDGRLDIVTSNGGTAANSVSVLLGAGAGTFGPHIEYATGANPRGVALGDVNGDGRLDVVAANYDVLTASVLLNAGGKFRMGAELTPAAAYRGLAVADLDGDGKLDIVTSALGEHAVIWKNVSAGSGHWLEVKAPIGSRVRAGNQWQEVTAGGSYGSGSFVPAHFGLGAATEADVEIVMPGGARKALGVVKASR